MHLDPLPVDGAYAVTMEAHVDERGFFARLFCEQEFAAAGLDPRINQINDSFTHDAGTLRGMHYQVGQSAETKLVRAVRGSVFDVVLDIRPASATFGRWAGLELTAENRRMMYVPRGCAHGYLTLAPDTELIYFSSQRYDASAERGVRWDDPEFGITWPIPPTMVSVKDASWPDFRPVQL